MPEDPRPFRVKQKPALTRTLFPQLVWPVVSALTFTASVALAHALALQFWKYRRMSQIFQVSPSWIWEDFVVLLQTVKMGKFSSSGRENLKHNSGSAGGEEWNFREDQGNNGAFQFWVVVRQWALGQPIPTAWPSSSVTGTQWGRCRPKEADVIYSVHNLRRLHTEPISMER